MRVPAMVMVTVMVLARLCSRAQADDAHLSSQLSIAQFAAQNRRCDVVGEIASEVKQTDSTYYANTFLADPQIASCLVVSRQPSEPPVHPERIVGELVIGGVAELGLGFVGAAAGYFSVAHGEDSEPVAGHHGADREMVGAALGVSVGATLGVYLIGSAGRETASGLATFGAATLGTAIGVGMLIASDGSPGCLAAAVALPAIGATLGFNATRSYESLTIAPVATGNSIGLAGTF